MSDRPPLAQEFGSKPGAYDLAIGVSQPIVDPGDRLQVEVYISGYGVIQAAKVAFYPSPEVVDYGKSRLIHSPKTHDRQLSGWGGATVEMSDPSYSTGGVVTLSGGWLVPASQKHTWFFDGNEKQIDNYQIRTEVRDPKGTSPIYLDLTVGNHATPGPHSIQFVLTYFDGQTWKTASKNADFTIRNFYQRHEGPIWWVGGTAAVLTILASIATLCPVVKAHWPVSLVLAALGAVAVAGGKATSEQRKRSRAK